MPLMQLPCTQFQFLFITVCSDQHNELTVYENGTEGRYWCENFYNETIHPNRTMEARDDGVCVELVDRYKDDVRIQ